MRPINKIIPALCLLALTSCGGSGNGGSGGGSGANTDIGTNPPTVPTPDPTPEVPQEMQVTEGTYKAILRPYNFNVAGWIPNGMTDIKIVANQIEVNSWLDDSANVIHMQNIHLGRQCPNAGHDLNQDGFVDFDESIQIANKILIPLDSDLNTQLAGLNIYPKGNFSYFQSASLETMMSDLVAADQDPSDLNAKLGPNESLNLEGKVIIVTGTAANRGLPETVSAISNQTRELSIPIACGVIERIPEIKKTTL
jgi:hypothetical protein